MATAAAVRAPKAAAAVKAPAEARIVGSGYRSMCEGGPIARCFWVASRHEPGVEYTVYLHSSGRLSCSCLSSRYRAACAHRTAVQRALDEEARQTRQAEASAEEELPRYGITPKGMAYLKRWRAEQAAIAEAKARETAPLRRDNRPFSMLKR